eukprot:g1242.t1
MSGVDYCLLDPAGQRPPPLPRATIRTLAGAAAVSILGLASFFSTGKPGRTSGSGIVQSESNTAIRTHGLGFGFLGPSGPGPLQLFIFDKFSSVWTKRAPSCVFLYGAMRKNVNSQHATEEEGWIYGAQASQVGPADAFLATVSGSPNAILKGVLLCYPERGSAAQAMQEVLLKEKETARESHLLGEVKVVRRDGSTVRALWIYQASSSSRTQVTFQSGRNNWLTSVLSGPAISLGASLLALQLLVLPHPLTAAGSASSPTPLSNQALEKIGAPMLQAEKAKTTKLSSRQDSWPGWTLPAPLPRPSGYGDLIYPDWFQGEWTVTSVPADPESKETTVTYNVRFLRNKKDRPCSLAGAVSGVICSAMSGCTLVDISGFLSAKFPTRIQARLREKFLAVSIFAGCLLSWE